MALFRNQFAKTSTPMAQVQRWIADLDDEEFTVREQASRNLERIEGEAKQPLEKAIKGDCSLEVRIRIKAVLEQLHGKDDRLCMIRGVELLELVGTTEAVNLLRQVEKKAGDDLIRAEALAALGRMTEERRAPR